MKNLQDCHFCGGSGLIYSSDNETPCEECLGEGYLIVESRAVSYGHYKEMLGEHQNNLNSVEYQSKASLEALYADLYQLAEEMLQELEDGE